MEDQANITVIRVKEKLFSKYQVTVEKEGGALHQTGMDAFREILDLTVGQDGAGVEQNWGRDHGFLYEVTERLAVRAARYADKQDKTTDIKRKHVIRAANCLIPDVSRYCMKDRVQDGSHFETKGVYCKDWEELPENGSS